MASTPSTCDRIMSGVSIICSYSRSIFVATTVEYPGTNVLHCFLILLIGSEDARDEVTGNHYE